MLFSTAQQQRRRLSRQLSSDACRHATRLWRGGAASTRRTTMDMMLQAFHRTMPLNRTQVQEARDAIPF